MVANRVREVRMAMGLSQVELSRRTRMAQSNLCAIENFRLAPWPKVMRSLARVLKTSREELFPSDQSKGC